MIHKKNSDWLLPALLSATAGAVDVIGFLALGVFMAHITGNLVILAAHYVTGRFGEIGPILSVPIFMLVLSVVTLAFVAVPTRVPRRALLVLQAILLAAFLSFAVVFGPFSNPDSGMAVLVGMLGVAAMATQNAVVRLALHGSPSIRAISAACRARSATTSARRASGSVGRSASSVTSFGVSLAG